jgi:hypothetical protein
LALIRSLEALHDGDLERAEEILLAELRKEGLGVYGGVQAVHCPDCPHVSPSREHLKRHVRRCPHVGWRAA